MHASGDVFEGLWSNERKHGLGVDTFADGRGYRGEFRNNKFAGVGTYYTGDGAIYQVRAEKNYPPTVYDYVSCNCNPKAVSYNNITHLYRH